MKQNELKLRNIIKEEVKNILNETTATSNFNIISEKVYHAISEMQSFLRKQDKLNSNFEKAVKNLESEILKIDKELRYKK